MSSSELPAKLGRTTRTGFVTLGKLLGEGTYGRVFQTRVTWITTTDGDEKTTAAAMFTPSLAKAATVATETPPPSLSRSHSNKSDHTFSLATSTPPHLQSPGRVAIQIMALKIPKSNRRIYSSAAVSEYALMHSPAPHLTLGTTTSENKHLAAKLVPDHGIISALRLHAGGVADGSGAQQDVARSPFANDGGTEHEIPKQFDVRDLSFLWALPMPMAVDNLDNVLSGDCRLLEGLLLKGALPTERWISQLLSAIDWLHHSLGVTHNDLKPQNILVMHVDRICVADLGSATAISLGCSASDIFPTPIIQCPQVFLAHMRLMQELHEEKDGHDTSVTAAAAAAAAGGKDDNVHYHHHNLTRQGLAPPPPPPSSSRNNTRKQKASPAEQWPALADARRLPAAMWAILEQRCTALQSEYWSLGVTLLFISDHAHLYLMGMRTRNIAANMEKFLRDPEAFLSQHPTAMRWQSLLQAEPRHRRWPFAESFHIAPITTMPSPTAALPATAMAAGHVASPRTLSSMSFPLSTAAFPTTTTNRRRSTPLSSDGLPFRVSIPPPPTSNTMHQVGSGLDWTHGWFAEELPRWICGHLLRKVPLDDTCHDDCKATKGGKGRRQARWSSAAICVLFCQTLWLVVHAGPYILSGGLACPTHPAEAHLFVGICVRMAFMILQLNPLPTLTSLVSRAFLETSQPKRVLQQQQPPPHRGSVFPSPHPLKKVTRDDAVRMHHLIGTVIRDQLYMRPQDMRTLAELDLPSWRRQVQRPRRPAPASSYNNPCFWFWKRVLAVPLLAKLGC